MQTNVPLQAPDAHDPTFTNCKKITGRFLLYICQFYAQTSQELTSWSNEGNSFYHFICRYCLLWAVLTNIPRGNNLQMFHIFRITSNSTQKMHTTVNSYVRNIKIQAKQVLLWPPLFEHKGPHTKWDEKFQPLTLPVNFDCFEPRNLLYIVLKSSWSPKNILPPVTKTCRLRQNLVKP